MESLLTDKQILDQFFTTLRDDVILNAHTQKRTASGNAERSLRIETGEEEGKLIDGSGYIIWGWEQGRGPGGMPPVNRIEQWIRDKGIAIVGNISIHSLAFLIARKIKERGTVLYQLGGNSGVLSNAITQQRVESLTETFGTKYLNEVSSEILTAFNDAWNS